MEVHVESANVDMLPKSCYVSVRVGETLKQGRYEPQRAYTFSAIDRRRDVRIDVYQHVGSCLLSAEPDSASVHDVFATSTHPDFPAMKFKAWEGRLVLEQVSMSTRSEDIQKSKTDRAEKISKMKGRAKEKLSEAVKASRRKGTGLFRKVEISLLAYVHARQALKDVLRKERPDGDAVDFVCKYLMVLRRLKAKESGSTKASSRPLQKDKEPEKPGEESFVSIDGTAGRKRPLLWKLMPERLRAIATGPAQRFAGCPVEAADNGQLESALKDAKTDPGEAEAAKAAAKAKLKTAHLLMSAAENGDLEEAVRQVKAEPDKNPTVEEAEAAKEAAQAAKVKLKTAHLLMSAAENGDLEEAVRQVKAEPDKNPTVEEAEAAKAAAKAKLKTAHLLMSAGPLSCFPKRPWSLRTVLMAKAVRQVKAEPDKNPTVEEAEAAKEAAKAAKVKLKTAHLLMSVGFSKASLGPSQSRRTVLMAKAVRQVKAEPDKNPTVEEAEAAAKVRLKTAHLLMSAAENGDLEAVRQVKAEPNGNPTQELMTRVPVKSCECDSKRSQRSPAKNRSSASMGQRAENVAKFQLKPTAPVEADAREVEAADNGQLESALKDAKTDPGEAEAAKAAAKVKLKTAHLLMSAGPLSQNAAENGDLEEAWSRFAYSRLSRLFQSFPSQSRRSVLMAKAVRQVKGESNGNTTAEEL
ncbi:unnamed protein product [Symbiodinium natans]|uniref:Uncharacterized protein n=1 Tax=Symbiodinium natans TaxID=878477 RepID=A0A812SD40_9DINO|nr:unnamed protein product [Symbiodinium natans]